MGEKFREKIRAAEDLIRRDGWSPSRFLKLTLLKAQDYEDNGIPLNQAKIQAYQEAISQVEIDESKFGKTPQTRATRFELQHAVRLIEAGDEDIIGKELKGVKPALLTEDKAGSLVFNDKDDYRVLIDDLRNREQLFGAYTERTNTRIVLEVARRLLD